MTPPTVYDFFARVKGAGLVRRNGWEEDLLRDSSDNTVGDVISKLVERELITPYQAVEKRLLQANRGVGRGDGEARGPTT